MLLTRHHMLGPSHPAVARARGKDRRLHIVTFRTIFPHPQTRELTMYLLACCALRAGQSSFSSAHLPEGMTRSCLWCSWSPKWQRVHRRKGMISEIERVEWNAAMGWHSHSPHDRFLVPPQPTLKAPGTLTRHLRTTRQAVRQPRRCEAHCRRRGQGRPYCLRLPCPKPACSSRPGAPETPF